MSTQIIATESDMLEWISLGESVPNIVFMDGINGKEEATFRSFMQKATQLRQKIKGTIKQEGFEAEQWDFSNQFGVKLQRVSAGEFLVRQIVFGIKNSDSTGNFECNPVFGSFTRQQHRHACMWSWEPSNTVKDKLESVCRRTGYTLTERSVTASHKTLVCRAFDEGIDAQNKRIVYFQKVRSMPPLSQLLFGLPLMRYDDCVIWNKMGFMHVTACTSEEAITLFINSATRKCLAKCCKCSQLVTSLTIRCNSCAAMTCRECSGVRNLNSSTPNSSPAKFTMWECPKCEKITPSAWVQYCCITNNKPFLDIELYLNKVKTNTLLCSAPGCKNTTKKHCPCLLHPLYCSRACQKLDWSKHKPNCSHVMCDIPTMEGLCTKDGRIAFDIRSDKNFIDSIVLAESPIHQVATMRMMGQPPSKMFA